MKRFLPIFLLPSLVVADLDTDLGLSLGDVIVLNGDSSTHGHMYSHYLLCWLQLSYPELDLMTYEVARSGSSLAGYYGDAPPITAPTESGYERYAYPFDPDLVIVSHGYNGGQAAAAHGTTMTSVWDDWVDNSARKLLLISHVLNLGSATDTQDLHGKADQEATLAATDALIFAANVPDEIGTSWFANYPHNGDSGSADFFQDGVTPFDGDEATAHGGPAAHAAYAWGVLQALGAESLVSEATINAATGTETSSGQCTLSGISGDASGIEFDRLDERLPWAIDETARAGAVAVFPAMSGWQEYSLTVANLNAGTYQIRIDGELVATATHTELAAGINLSDVTTGPVWEQCQEVLGEMRDLQGYDRDTGVVFTGGAASGTVAGYHSATLGNYQNGGLRGTDYFNAMQTVISNMDANMAEIHADAQPVTRTWSILPAAGASYAGPVRLDGSGGASPVLDGSGTSTFRLD